MNCLRAILFLALGLGLSGCVPGGLMPVEEPASPTGSQTSDSSAILPVPKNHYESWGAPNRLVGLGSGAKPEGFTDPPGDGTLAAYFAQQLEWVECRAGECVTFKAPLDWFNPGEQAITIQMVRQKGASNELGSIFVNPGGPGGSASGYAAYFDPSGLPGYDIIGMDSRGSGYSTPVVCGDVAETDRYLAVDSSPDDRLEEAALRDAQMDFARLCRARSGALLDHITSVETIYDYDLARALLGEEKLNFYGVSYGTFLGALYAELYPDRVGRMVLDSAVNLQPQAEVPQDQGFDQSFAAFADWCATTADCRLGNSRDEVTGRVTRLLQSMDTLPLRTDDPERVLTQSLGVTGIMQFFYFGEDAYDNLADVLYEAVMYGNGEYLLRSADQYNGRFDDGSGYGQLIYSFPAIACVDEIGNSELNAYAGWEEATSRAPLFGRFFGPNVMCTFWTAKPMAPIDFSGAGAPPILVVQNTGDAATPARNAEVMAEELESAVLVKRVGAGHGAYQEGSECLDSAVNEYFLNGTVPQDGLQCTS